MRKRSTRHSASGFTLIEVSLAVVIGVMVLAGAVALYNQARFSAASTRANEKTMALQMLVEELAASSGGAYPPVPTVYHAWVQRRPDDHNKSPWGGDLGTDSGTITAQSVYAPGFTGDEIGSGVEGPGVEPSFRGVVQYYRCLPGATGSIFDRAKNAQVTYSGYRISSVGAKGDYWWFVKTAR
ncbi:hypothetical protein D3C86_911090 [compost metagenome]